MKTGQGIQGAKDALNFPMFAPTNPDVPQLQPALKFKATTVSEPKFSIEIILAE